MLVAHFDAWNYCRLLVFLLLKLRRFEGGDGNRRACLEAYAERIPQRTGSAETWLVVNEFPRAVEKNGGEITK